MTTAREIHLTAYPTAMPTPDMFQLVERDLPSPTAGQAEVEVLYITVDPYMRGRMRPEVKSYIPPFALNACLDGGAVCRVVNSEADGFAAGDMIVTPFGAGWRDRAVIDMSVATKIDTNIAPASAYLGVLGMPGLTAWAGLTQIIEPKEGQTLYVSGAAGAVGSLVCQLGKHYGMQVLGSAGSQAKRDWLTNELGVDHVFDYRAHDAGSLTKAILEQAPGGVHGYFENVGGMQMEALLNALTTRGRIALCGMIAVYNNDTPAPGPSNLTQIIGKGLRVEGFVVTMFAHLQEQFFKEVGPLVASSKITARETVYNGLEKAPEAFIGLFSGDNTGKAVVKVGS